VFLSSTFYDFRQVRADLERFIRDMGFDPVLNERGNIPYGNEEKLEEYCYKEIELCDILLSIVGGRFGTGSQHAPYSISQMELKTALSGVARSCAPSALLRGSQYDPKKKAAQEQWLVGSG
jgi:hypothetical protein